MALKYFPTTTLTTTPLSQNNTYSLIKKFPTILENEQLFYR